MEFLKSIWEWAAANSDTLQALAPFITALLTVVGLSIVWIFSRIGRKALSGPYLQKVRRDAPQAVSAASSAVERVASVRLPTASAPQRPEDGFSVCVRDHVGSPVVGAQVYAFRENGTSKRAESQMDGIATVPKSPSGYSELFVSKGGFMPTAQPVPADVDAIVVVLEEMVQEGGGLIVDGTGHIPGFAGRLNPIKDDHGRHYLYADNISCRGSGEQPYKFELGRPFVLEDSNGVAAEVTILHFIGRVSLLAYELNPALASV